MYVKTLFSEIDAEKTAYIFAFQHCILHCFLSLLHLWLHNNRQHELRKQGTRRQQTLPCMGSLKLSYQLHMPSQLCPESPLGIVIAYSQILYILAESPISHWGQLNQDRHTTRHSIVGLRKSSIFKKKCQKKIVSSFAALRAELFALWGTSVIHTPRTINIYSQTKRKKERSSLLKKI